MRRGFFGNCWDRIGMLGSSSRGYISAIGARGRRYSCRHGTWCIIQCAGSDCRGLAKDKWIALCAVKR